MSNKINKKLLSDYSIRIGLLIFLLLLPLENVYADGRDHSFENLAAVSVILMIAMVSIIFALIFARGKELLTKVITFCVLLVSIFFLALSFGVTSSIFALAAIIMYIHIRFPSLSLQEKKYIRKFIFIFIFLLIISLLSIVLDSIIN